MDTIQGTVETGLLKRLFEARLQYQSDMDVVVSAETREGALVGSGDRWDSDRRFAQWESSLVDVCWQLRLCLCASRG